MFTKNVPQEVEDAEAEHLLSIGRFQAVEIFAQTQNTTVDDLEDLIPMDSSGAMASQPKNKVGSDDLSGKRILLRRSGGIGDVVFVAHVAQFLKSRFPTCKITLAANVNTSDMASCFDCFDKVITMGESSQTGTIRGFDYIIPFGGTLGSEMASGCDDSEYFQAHWDRAGIEESVPETLPMLEILNQVGNSDIQGNAAEVLHDVGFRGNPYVVLLLGTSNPLKRLPVDALRRIAVSLASDEGHELGTKKLRVLCLGGDQDRVFPPSDKNIAIRTDLPISVSMELARKSLCVIGADTGIMQYAASIGVPTVSVWGPTDHSLSLSRYPGDTSTVTAKIECSPCKRLRTSHCPYFKSGYSDCMLSINSQEIINETYRVLKENKSHPSRDLTQSDARERKKLTKSTSTRTQVAVLLDLADTFTGGGFYTWNLAKILSNRPGTDVTVFTDTGPDEFVYTLGDHVPATLSVVKYGDSLADWKPDAEYDLVVGTPPFTGITAVKAKKHVIPAKKVCLLVYETPSYISDFREGRDGKEEFWKKYKAALKKADSVFCISGEVRRSLQEWIPEIGGITHVVSPVINQEIADKAIGEGNKRRNLVVLIARNMKYKKLMSAVHAIAEEIPETAVGKNRAEICVIGDKVKGLEKKLLESWKVKCDFTFLENAAEDVKWSLLSQAKVLIHPSTFEGFGIPVAEGLYAGAHVVARNLPVLHEEFGDVVTYYSDDEELYSKVAPLLIHGLRDEESIERGKSIVKSKFTPAPISRVLESALDLDSKKSDSGGKKVKVAHVAPWNAECGIAETLERFVSLSDTDYKVFSYTDVTTLGPDTDGVVRCWDRSFTDYSVLKREIFEYDPHIVHIQHEHSLFQNTDRFFDFIRDMQASGMKVVVTLHTFLPSRFTDNLIGLADRVVFTKEQSNVPDTTRVANLPIGTGVQPMDKVEARAKLGIPRDNFVVGSFGMWQVHKGFAEFLDTYETVDKRIGKDALTYIISGSHPKKSQYHVEARRKHVGMIEHGHIKLFTDFASLEDLMLRLSACDCLVFNYSVAHYYSASAALRMGIAAERPIICTHSPMFSEFEHDKQVLKQQFTDSNALTEAIVRLHGDEDLRNSLVDTMNQFASMCTPTDIANVHDMIYNEVVFGEDELEV
jgi:glycosyltransferase involved in cell wall biosynthesis/ADP-heptose:LPS heptosyltransferase